MVWQSRGSRPRWRRRSQPQRQTSGQSAPLLSRRMPRACSRKPAGLPTSRNSARRQFRRWRVVPASGVRHHTPMNRSVRAAMCPAWLHVAQKRAPAMTSPSQRCASALSLGKMLRVVEVLAHHDQHRRSDFAHACGKIVYAPSACSGCQRSRPASIWATLIRSIHDWFALTGACVGIVLEHELERARQRESRSHRSAAGFRAAAHAPARCCMSPE